MTRTARIVVLACLVGLLGPALFCGPAAGRAPSVEGFDSGTRVVREVAEALIGAGRSILECYPWGSRTFLGFVSLFSERTRIALIDWGMRLSVGHRARNAGRLDVESLSQWCVDQYPQDRRYSAIVIGSPNGAVAHLAALLGAPFLTTSFGLTFRHPTIDNEDHLVYLESARAIVDSIVAANPSDGYELITHYDPLHDRSIVEIASFVRVKLTALPAAYRAFIDRHLEPGGTLVVVDCTFTWPQYELGGRSFLQVGGLGGIAPETFLERWPLDLPVVARAESEWGCPDGFAEAVARFAAERGFELVKIGLDHPWAYSRLVYNAYLACEGVRSGLLLIDCFNHLNPRTNVEIGVPALWLPFNTTEGPALVEAALRDGGALDRILFTPLPSFAGSPDTASLPAWIDLLRGYGEVELFAIDSRLYPADPLAPYRFADRMADLRDRLALDRPLRLPIAALAALVDGRAGGSGASESR